MVPTVTRPSAQAATVKIRRVDPLIPFIIIRAATAAITTTTTRLYAFTALLLLLLLVEGADK
jgi:hypothetical protein